MAEALSTHHSTPEILIVDDSRIQAEMLRKLLESEQYRVRLANDGQAALDQARNNPPSLIISDVVMPIMDGYELCRHIKADPSLRTVPVILITTLAEMESVVKALHARADYYLHKPYDGRYLLSKVRSALQNNAAATETLGAPPTVTVNGTAYPITAEPRDMLNLLLATCEHSVEQNHRLVETQRELQSVNHKLREHQAQLEHANQRLEMLATQDGLTGLKNHRAFKERLVEEVDRCNRYSTPLSLVMLDVDRFKQYNDTFGHPAGDEALKTVAGVLIEQARTTDLVARYGGEEMVILLPNTNRDASVLLADRVRKAVETAHWTSRVVTVSMGVATMQPITNEQGKTQTKSGDELIAEADEALYESKKQGRNRVSHHADLWKRFFRSAN